MVVKALDVDQPPLAMGKAAAPQQHHHMPVRRPKLEENQEVAQCKDLAELPQFPVQHAQTSPSQVPWLELRKKHPPGSRRILGGQKNLSRLRHHGQVMKSRTS